ncbi:GGDEF domain-containing protein [Acinetobacter sp. WCHAc060025]|uniref:GGDEF domain-containing protein n=1 Tax=Acinetobacter sp. WCHAc060025 TaxID=2518625 RepID=UPI001022C909|nr:diguanylate cyclase [Acinetobacter sp. WCHAc060025]RZG77230.1 diguanylate cyclase [Acinetobacter sp. WCHAc060025]
MEHESINLKDNLEQIKVFEYLESIDKLHLVSFISQIPLPIAIFDDTSRCLGANQKFADIYESDALYLIDKLLSTFSTVVYARFQEALDYFHQNQNYLEQEFYVKGRFYLAYFKAIRNADNAIEMIVVVCSDVTRLKRRENVLLQNNKKLHDHLYLDLLTGLQNALAFDHYLNKLWQNPAKTDVSFLKIDLDNFKLFNQINSYTVGDEALVQLGAVLNEVIRQTEAQLFRLNSASFIVVIEHLTDWAVMTLGERLKFAITDAKILFDKNNQYLTASVGIFHFSQASDDHGVDVLEKIEIAIQQAKKNGANSLFLLKS